ncbi:MAG: hypothetical protein M0C28_23485 [Candidatus Moduliflexus flocculans]|nr:hypothetical protein [Candidatus Moduliflexus flocculans]
MEDDHDSKYDRDGRENPGQVPGGAQKGAHHGGQGPGSEVLHAEPPYDS